MADIELLIKIDEDAYKEIKKIVADENEMCFMQKLIANGTPLNEVLDKIRAEIVEMWKNEPCAIEGGCLDEVLEVIDKYKIDKEIIE